MHNPHNQLALWAASFSIVLSMACGVARAGEIADDAAQAEQLLQSGNATGALAAFDRASDAFWQASPLQLLDPRFVSKVSAFGDYTPRPDGPFRVGEPAIVYFEPYGYGFTPDGEEFRIALSVDTEIRSPGGIIFAKAPDFAQLEWKSRSNLHGLNGSVTFGVPKLKPGDYQLLLTVRDQASSKTATTTLPFSVAN